MLRLFRLEMLQQQLKQQQSETLTSIVEQKEEKRETKESGLEEKGKEEEEDDDENPGAYSETKTESDDESSFSNSTNLPLPLLPFPSSCPLSSDVFSRLSNGGYLRQMMFTQSSHLSNAFTRYYNRMSRAAGMGVRAEKESVDTIPNDFRRLQAHHFPLFLTATKLLLMLDGTTDHPFFGTATAEAENEQDAEADSMSSSAVSSFSSSSFSSSSPSSRLIRRLDDILNYTAFDEIYWPKLNEDNKKKLSSAKVWTEIIAVIKGQPAVLHSADGYLSEKEYLEYSTRRSTLSSDTKQRIYNCFQQYRQLKRSREEFDICDACLHIYKQLQARGKREELRIDFVYVDEVQDLLPIQLILVNATYNCFNSELNCS